MSSTSSHYYGYRPVEVPAGLPHSTRVDAPHPVGEVVAVEVVPEPSADATAPQAGDRRGEQLERQAEEIGLYLRRQRAALDHREAEVNARLAAVESEIRAARLWLGERFRQCEEQKSDLDRREREVEQQLAELAKEKASLEQTHRALSTERRLAEVAALRQVPTAGTDDTRSAAQRGRLGAAEVLLAEERTELAEERRQLTRDREANDRAMEMERQALAEDRDRFSAEVEAKKTALRQQRGDLTARRDALQKLRDEIYAAKRTAMEMRLATEELWAHLQGALAPAALTESISRIRLELAEQNRLTLDEVAEQREQLDAAGQKIAEDLERLKAQKAELQQWATRREQGINQSALRLKARESQLDEEARRMKRQRSEWLAERRTLQQELRKLLVEQDREPAGA